MLVLRRLSLVRCCQGALGGNDDVICPWRHPADMGEGVDLAARKKPHHVRTMRSLRALPASRVPRRFPKENPFVRTKGSAVPGEPKKDIKLTIIMTIDGGFALITTCEQKSDPWSCGEGLCGERGCM